MGRPRSAPHARFHGATARRRPRLRYQGPEVLTAAIVARRRTPRHRPPPSRPAQTPSAHGSRALVVDLVPEQMEATLATHLTPDQMKQFVRDHFEDFVNKRKTDVIHKNMTPDFLDHDGPGGRPTGVDGDEQMMLGMYKAMADLHLTIEDMVAEGDKVVCRNIWRWTIPASGKRMQFHGFVLWRFEGGRIAERWATVTSPAEGDSWTKS